MHHETANILLVKKQLEKATLKHRSYKAENANVKHRRRAVAKRRLLNTEGLRRKCECETCSESLHLGNRRSGGCARTSKQITSSCQRVTVLLCHCVSTPQRTRLESCNMFQVGHLSTSQTDPA